jgi:hypothetical protein
MTYYSFAIIWPRAVAVLYTASASRAGWMDTIVGACFLLGQISSNAIAHYVNPRIVLRIVAPIAMAFVAATAANLENEGLSVGMIILGALFSGCTDGLAITLTTVVIHDQEEIGTAGGLGGAIRSAGGALGNVVYTTILTNRLAKTIPALVPAAAIGAGLPKSSVSTLISALGGVVPFTDVHGLNDSILSVATAAYRQANAQAFKTVFLATMSFNGIAVICTWFIPTLNTKHQHYVPRVLQRNAGKVQNVGQDDIA